MSADATLKLISLPIAEAERLHKLSARGDPEGVSFFDELWTDEPCFMCDAPLSPGEGVTMILPDAPNAKRGLCMLGRQCEACSALPYQVRMHRLVKIMKAMWPGWHPARRSWKSGRYLL